MERTVFTPNVMFYDTSSELASFHYDKEGNLVAISFSQLPLS
jgi:hypothetical protein